MRDGTLLIVTPMVLFFVVRFRASTLRCADVMKCVCDVQGHLWTEKITTEFNKVPGHLCQTVASKNKTTVKRTQCPLRSPTSTLFRQIHVSVCLPHFRADFFVCFSKWWTCRAFLFFPSTDQTGRHQRVSFRLHCLWRCGRVLACSPVLRTATPTSSRHDITGLQHL